MLLTLAEKTLATFNVPQAIDIGHTFPTNPRKPPWAKRKPSDIKYLVIHHSASTATMQAENRYHTDPVPKGNDWYKLSYHISIDRGGIYQINDLMDITAHAKGANANGIGICVNWDLRLRVLTEFERNALYAVIITLKESFPNAEVVGHNEISLRLANHKTSCPVISMIKFRSDLMTAELKQELTETPNDNLAKAVAVNARVADLYKTASTAGKYQAEAFRKINRIADMMKVEGIL